MSQIGFVGLGRMGGNMVARIKRDSDHDVVHNGYISITPLHMDLTNYPIIEMVNSWALDL